jgi:hypothetical protein
MDGIDTTRLIAAVLAAGMLRLSQDPLTRQQKAPSPADAVTAYAQCLQLLRARQSTSPADY